MISKRCSTQSNRPLVLLLAATPITADLHPSVSATADSHTENALNPSCSTEEGLAAWANPRSVTSTTDDLALQLCLAPNQTYRRLVRRPTCLQTCSIADDHMRLQIYLMTASILDSLVRRLIWMTPCLMLDSLVRVLIHSQATALSETLYISMKGTQAANTLSEAPQVSMRRTPASFLEVGTSQSPCDQLLAVASTTKKLYEVDIAGVLMRTQTMDIARQGRSGTDHMEQV